MRKEDKNITIGLFGIVLSLVLIIISCFTIADKFPLICLFFICLGVFFIGYCFDGIRTGITFFIGIIGILFLAYLSGGFSKYLVDKGYIPQRDRGIIGLLFLLGSMFLIKLILKIRTKKSNKSQEQTDIEKQQEEFSLDGTYVILIKPNMFKTDIVYKVFEKNGYFFFCRIGGQFYGINESVFDLTPDKDEAWLLSDKDNFKLELKDIKDITAGRKKSMWTGAIPNNGTIEFTFESKKEKYIIHPTNEYDYVIAYINNIGIKLVEKGKRI